MTSIAQALINSGYKVKQRRKAWPRSKGPSTRIDCKTGYAVGFIG